MNKSTLLKENEQLLQGVKVRQHKLGKMSSYLLEIEDCVSKVIANAPDAIVFLDECKRAVQQCTVKKAS